ncbi:hypothetical protein T552_03193 [Pneumocystis carinii B80]|uniref:Uncharacterized protein n=1 Tax=Pneumocystis carinii (strain B80) TaxID=1408658 RepID=A0A0W4ZBZ2_PNEC8|nr:hypothetical protein T552_03193 [Pneumocystis carinii B80]KTW25919.1 hypothetical protein T552_03193 [Pneumocystis carinii B80]
MASRRQDYIFRVRYQNKLPLPPFFPKMLNIPIPLNNYTKTSYLSSLIQEQPIDIELDPELGIPLDLSMISNVFEGIYDNMHKEPKDVKLDPKDVVLLKEVSSVSQRNSAGVSFLRRTEYISSESAKTAVKPKAFDPRFVKSAELTNEKLEDPEKQVVAIETTFKEASKNWLSFTHPHKKNLTVVDSFPIFPNINISDQQFLLMKFTTDPEQKNISSQMSNDGCSDLALFMPVSGRGEEWLAYYLPEQESYNELKETLKNQDFEKNKSPFIYNHVHDYDTTMHINSTPLDEIALVFRNDPKTKLKSAFYSPIYAKSTLKRRRSKIPNGMIKNLSVSNIELKLRPLNEEESREKKKHCSMLDIHNCFSEE